MASYLLCHWIRVKSCWITVRPSWYWHILADEKREFHKNERDENMSPGPGCLRDCPMQSSALVTGATVSSTMQQPGGSWAAGAARFPSATHVQHFKGSYSGRRCRSICIHANIYYWQYSPPTIGRSWLSQTFIYIILYISVCVSYIYIYIKIHASSRIFSHSLWHGVILPFVSVCPMRASALVKLPLWRLNWWLGKKAPCTTSNSGCHAVFPSGLGWWPAWLRRQAQSSASWHMAIPGRFCLQLSDIAHAWWLLSCYYLAMSCNTCNNLSGMEQELDAQPQRRTVLGDLSAGMYTGTFGYIWYWVVAICGPIARSLGVSPIPRTHGVKACGRLWSSRQGFQILMSTFVMRRVDGGAHDIRFIRCIPLTSVDNVMCPDIGGSTRGFD